MTSSQDPSSNWIVHGEEDYLNISLSHNMIAETQFEGKYVTGLEVSPFGNVKFDKNTSELDEYLSNWTHSDQQQGRLSDNQQGRSFDQCQGRSSDQQQSRSSDQQQGRSTDQQQLTESQRIDHMSEYEQIDFLADLLLEEPCQPNPQQQQQISKGMNNSEIGGSNITKSCNLENGFVQNSIQYSELKQLPNKNQQNAWKSKSVKPNSEIGMIDYFTALITEGQCQTKTQSLHQNEKIMTSNAFDGSNTSQKSNLEYNHLQNSMQYREFNQLPTTNTNKYKTTNESELSNKFINQKTNYQNLHGLLNSQQCQQENQNKQKGGDLKCIISQGVNTKGHMTVYPEYTQNSFCDNVEKGMTETSCMKKRKKYEEDPHEDEEEEKRRLQAKKAKNYRDKKKEELRMKEDQIKQIKEELQKSEREKMAYCVENKQLKEEIKKKNVLLQLYEGN